MSTGLKLGRWCGIELTADWSWTLVFALVTWNQSAVFSSWHPEWKVGTSLFVALIAAASFFASVVVHELGHALIARTFRIRVRRVHLFLFGGVSNIEREPPSPYSEFLMALGGPLASLLLGLVLLLAGTAHAVVPSIDPQRPWNALAGLDPLSSILVWLGPMNIALAVFNLIPGFPLDGGRLLRAVIWSVTRDLQSATRWASSVGQALGWSFVVLGIVTIFGAHVPFFGRAFIGGLWLAIIGLFLSLAAEQSYRRVLVQSLLESIVVGQTMRRHFVGAPAGMMDSEGVSAEFMQSHERALPDAEEDPVFSLVSSGNLPRIREESGSSSMRVSEIMTPASRLIVIAPEDNLDEALGKLTQNGVEQLPVVTEGHLVGMLDRRDLARWIELQVEPAPAPERVRAH